MKNVSTKIAYMVIGSLLTLIGYNFGNIETNTATAQKDDAIVDEIQCRRLVVVGDDDTSRVILGTSPDDAGRVLIGNEKSELCLLLSAETSEGFNTGSIVVMTEGRKVAGVITSDMYGGYMAVHTRNGLARKALVQMSTTEDGDGFLITRDKTEEMVKTIGGEKNKLSIESFRDLIYFPHDEIFRQLRKYKSDAPGDVELEDRRALTVDDLQRLGDKIPSALPKILRKGDKIPSFNSDDCNLRMYTTWYQSTIGEVKNEIVFPPNGMGKIILKDGTRYTSPEGCTIRDFTIISGSLIVNKAK